MSNVFLVVVVVFSVFVFIFNLDSCRLIIYAASLQFPPQALPADRQQTTNGGFCMKVADGAFDLGLSYARKAGALL